MQEDIERRAIAISLTAGKLTARTLAKDPAAETGGSDATGPSIGE